MKAYSKQSPQAPSSGASLIEYVLLVSLIAVICVASLIVIGDATNQKYSAIASGLNR